MLTAIVVHKDAEQKPGSGFVACASALGLDVSDPDRLWNEQLTFVHNYWMRSASANE